MAKFKVIKEFVMNGVTYKEEQIIDLTHAQQQLKSIQANIQPATEEEAKSAGDTSVLGGLKPGQPMTEEQKKKLAAENAAQTQEAHRLAADQIARDNAEGGREKPVVQEVADSIKDKLENLPPVTPETPADGNV